MLMLVQDPRTTLGVMDDWFRMMVSFARKMRHNHYASRPGESKCGKSHQRRTRSSHEPHARNIVDWVMPSPGFLRGPAAVAADSRLPANRRLWLDLEAEHHAALVVLGYVAMGHPQAGIGHVEEDIDRLAGRHQDGVLPDEVGLDDTVAG